MKKIIIRIAIGLVVLVVLAVAAVFIFLDAAVKRGVETVGPKLTKVEVKLDAAHISIFSGSGSLKGFLVGNPEGYKTPQAISVGKASLALKPGSLLSDKLVITSINVESPDITFEGGLSGNNLKTILNNINETTGGGTTPTNATPKEAKKANKKLEVDDFAITGAKLHLSITGLTSNAVPIVLPPIHLTNLGTGPDGITVTELSKRVLTAIEQEAAKAAASGLTDLGKGATGLTKGAGKAAGDAAGQVTKSIGDLFKKKGTN